MALKTFNYRGRNFVIVNQGNENDAPSRVGH
jgi:hypothetical protein